MAFRLFSTTGRRSRRGSSQNLYLLLCVLLAAAVLVVALAVFHRPSDGDAPHTPTASGNDASDYPDATPYDTENLIQFNGMDIPVVEGVPVNDYGVENFAVEDDGGVIYTAGWYAEGIDVSAHNEGIDWQAVADSGIEFAIIRCAYRGYGSGGLYLDEAFHANMEGALNAGLDVGVYVFSQAINVKEAAEEARFVLDAISEYPVSYPVVFDWERVTWDDGRTAELGTDVMSACAKAFCSVVSEAGYRPSVYINMTEGYLGFDLTIISEYDIWLAEYDTHPDFYYHFNIWQYTNEGYVPGIEGDVDRNLCFRDFASE